MNQDANQESTTLSQRDVENMQTIIHQAHRIRSLDEAVAKQHQVISSLHQALNRSDAQKADFARKVAEERSALNSEVDKLKDDYLKLSTQYENILAQGQETARTASRKASVRKPRQPRKTS